MDSVDTVIIGAGVVGLACARACALAGQQVVIVEAANAIGTGISSRNSEVIHAGIYYPQGSLKACLCVEGNRMIRDYADKNGVPYAMVGKLIVATRSEEDASLALIQAKAAANGAVPLQALSGRETSALEPEVKASAALLSPATGIIDSHALMLALLGEAEGAGAVLALSAKIVGGRRDAEGIVLKIAGEEDFSLRSSRVVIAAGLHSPAIATMLGLQNIPKGYFCKGNYFSLSGKTPFSRLVYPVPEPGGLGVHFTLDMAGRGRFGPDVEWIDSEDYAVNEARLQSFVQAIQRYWPGCRAEDLAPSYSGIRPKICAKGAPDEDFRILGPADHGVPGVVALLGIESPGLTSCLPLAEHVVKMI